MRSAVSRRAVLSGLASAGAVLGVPRRLRAQGAFPPASLRLAIFPGISSGSFFIAQAKGYFERVGLTVNAQSFASSGLAIPALAAGELDFTVTTISAGIFNAMAKGGGFKMFLDRGNEAPGRGSLAIFVNKKLYADGLKTIRDLALARGQKVGLPIRGSIGHYVLARALEQANVAEDQLDWNYSMANEVAVQLMAADSLSVSVVAVPLVFAALKQNAGHAIAWSDDVTPNAQLACWGASDRVLKSDRSVAVRFAMVHLQSSREFMRAAQTGNPDILKILSDATRLPVEVINNSRPRFSSMALDGMPNKQSVIEQVRYWHEKTALLPKMVAEDEIFELDIVREANSRLEQSNPFG